MYGGDIFGRRPPSWRGRVAGVPGRAGRLTAGGVVLVVALVLGMAPWAAQAASDPRVPEQWALAAAAVPPAWPAATGADVRIGLVDTGVDLRHEDLAGKVVAHTNCVGAAGDPTVCAGSGQDANGHGTHVAGILVARRANGRGVAGVAPGAQLLVARALTADGSGSIEDINAGIRWVVDRGARVVTLSLGGNYLVSTLLTSSLRHGIAYAWSRGAVPVLAAGNANQLGLTDAGARPGRLPVLVVGATDRDGRVARYSGPVGDAQWAILAPGGAGTGGPAEDVLSTYWVRGRSNEYRALAGTSMATAHVAGTVAMLLARGLSPEQAVHRILATAAPDAACHATAAARCPGRLDVGAATARSVPARPARRSA